MRIKEETIVTGFDDGEKALINNLSTQAGNFQGNLSNALSYMHDPQKVVMYITNALVAWDEVMKRIKSLELLRDKANLDRDVVIH